MRTHACSPTNTALRSDTQAVSIDGPAEQAAYVIGVEPATFRKRLARARERVRALMSEQ